MPELDTSVFVVPRAFVKNGLDRFVVLNRIAKSVIDGCRGEHQEFMFTRRRKPITRIYNSGWKAARHRASNRFASEFGRSCPKGFQSIRVHDLKHTYGHRLRAGGTQKSCTDDRGGSGEAASALPAHLAAETAPIASDENRSLSSVIQHALRALVRSRRPDELRELQGYWAGRARATGIRSQQDLGRLLRRRIVEQGPLR